MCTAADAAPAPWTPERYDQAIFVVEMPHAAAPRAWWSPDQAEFFRRVEQTNINGHVIFEETTARHLAQPAGHEAHAARELGDRFGWDTPLYRADHIFDGLYRVEPIEALSAYEAAVRRGLKNAYFLYGADEALDAIDQPNYWLHPGGVAAHRALTVLLARIGLLQEDSMTSEGLAAMIARVRTCEPA